jgi:hypothetical protein
MSDVASSPDSDISCYIVVITTPDAILNVRREPKSTPGAPNGHTGLLLRTVAHSMHDARYKNVPDTQSARDCSSSLLEDRQLISCPSTDVIMTFTGIKKIIKPKHLTLPKQTS